jgi:hypothetical protein
MNATESTNKTGVISYDITHDEMMSFDMMRQATALAKSAGLLDAEGRKCMDDGLRIETEGEALFAKGAKLYTDAKYGAPSDTKKSLAARLADGYHIKAEGTRQIQMGRRLVRKGRKLVQEGEAAAREGRRLKREARKLDDRVAAGLAPELPVNVLTD